LIDAVNDLGLLTTNRRRAASHLACGIKTVRSKTSFMKTSLLHFGAMIALSLVGSAVGASSLPVVRPDPQAFAAATKWFSVVDAGNYAQSFAMFPARITSGGEAVEKNWIGYLRARRAPLGRPLSRKFGKAQFSRTLAGCPDGYYEFLTYNTAFEHKSQTTEQLTLTKESGHWQVSGYRFR
jgi:hypothetical protein